MTGVFGLHQCLSVDHHSFQDGELVCKEGVDCVILIAILAGERRGQYIHLGLISSMSDIIIFHSLSALCVELSILKVFIQAN